jgi:hypothetical protein
MPESITIGHLVKPGETLTQIATFYHINIENVQYKNEETIIAEISDDNDLTGAYLSLDLPLGLGSPDQFLQYYQLLNNAVAYGDPTHYDFELSNLNSYLHQCGESALRSLLASIKRSDAVDDEAAFWFHTAHQVWNHASGVDGQAWYMLRDSGLLSAAEDPFNAMRLVDLSYAAQLKERVFTIMNLLPLFYPGRFG